MSWTQFLNRPRLGLGADEGVRAALRELLPRFQAPTEPQAWQAEAAERRARALREVYLRGYSQEVIEADPRPAWDTPLRPEAPYQIKRLRYEACPNYWVPALMYEPLDLPARAPVALVAQGHYHGGKASEYLQALCANLARRGVIALTYEYPGMGQLFADSQHFQQAQLSLTGMAGAGLFYLAMKKALDVLLAHPQADPERVAMTGLSGGGWQTITLSALDPRITLSVPVAGYTSLRARLEYNPDIGDLEQCPPDMATVLDYPDLTAMLAPRPALLIFNAYDDCCFQADRTRPVVYDAVRPAYAAFGALDRFEFYRNTDPGTHNYDADNRNQFYRFIGRHFGLDAPAHDLHHRGEIFSEDELETPLPAEQVTMAQIALERAARLQPQRPLPRTPGERQALRERLRKVLRLPDPAAAAVVVIDRQPPRILMELAVGPWSFPLYVHQPEAAGTARLILSDGGRSNWPVPREAGEQALFVPEVLGIGGNSPAALLQQLVETAGQRLLGIQVAQTLAAARLAQELSGAGRLELEAHGRLSGFIALVAAGLEPQRFSKLTLMWNLPSLTQLLYHQVDYAQCPSLYCPDLLTVADVPQLKRLLEDVAYHQPARNVPPVRYDQPTGTVLP